MRLRRPARDRVEAVGGHTSLAHRKRHAGQRLLLGLPGPGLSADDRYLARQVRPAGWVIFEHNVEEPAQLAELVRELGDLADPADPALIAVDQEGGRFTRIRATDWPPMRALARSGLVAEVSAAMAAELAALGIHWNLAPVVDVDSQPANPIIGDRSFGPDPTSVSEHAAAFVRAHHAAGIATAAKHFPGHGDTTEDSHVALPVVEAEDPQLRERELAPFRAAVAAGVASVMTAHVRYPAWDEEAPATLSPRIVPRLLREELGFDGPVLSDDLNMAAVADLSLDQVVAGCDAATVDLLLCVRDPERQVGLYEALVRAQEVDRARHRFAEHAMARVHALRERFLLEPPRRPPLDRVGCREHRDLAALVRVRGAQ